MLLARVFPGEDVLLLLLLLLLVVAVAVSVPLPPTVKKFSTRLDPMYSKTTLELAAVSPSIHARMLFSTIDTSSSKGDTTV